MAIQFSFLTNGYVGHGYSVAVIGVGDAGQEALFTLDLPMYCDDTFSLARMVYVNDDNAIKRGGASEPPYYVEEYTEGAWPSTREKDDPLHPCKVCDWIFVLADLNEEGSIETIKKCAEAHTQHEHEEKKFICVTYAEDESFAKETLGGICDLIVFTDKAPTNLMRPVELILFDMYGGCVFQNKPTSKSIKSYVSLLYGLAPFEERSMLQAMNLWYEELRKEHPGEDVIELNLSDF